jgi:stage III sporulation protein AE
MRKIILTFIILLMLVILAVPAYAEDVTDRQLDGLNTDEIEQGLDEQTQQILDGFSVADAADGQNGIEKIWTAVTENFDEIFKGGLKSACMILSAAVLCAVVSASFTGENSYCITAGVLAVAAISINDVNSFIGLGSQTLDSIQTFATMLLPTLSAAATASGAITSGTAKYAAAMLFMNILMNVSEKVVMPVIYAYTAAGIAGAAMGTDGLKSAAALMKWIAVTLMKGIIIVFVTYLALTGVISGTSDAATARVAKTAISTALPVVGGIISDATDTVLAGAAIVKNTLGVFGLVATAAICVLPFLRLGINYLLYKACAGLTGAIAHSRICSAVETISNAFGMILGLVGSGAIMLFLSVISFMKAVT